MLSEDEHLPGAGRLQTRDQGQAGRLATACGADQRAELTRPDAEVDVMNGRVNATAGRQKGLGHAPKLDGRHHCVDDTMTAGRITRNPSGLSELIVLFGQEGM